MSRLPLALVDAGENAAPGPCELSGCCEFGRTTLVLPDEGAPTVVVLTVVVTMAAPVIVVVPPAKTGELEPPEPIPLAAANDPKVVPRLARPEPAARLCV